MPVPQPATPQPAPVVAHNIPENRTPPGTFSSLDQMIDVAPQATLQKLTDPATLDAGIAELNEFLDKNVKGKPATLRFTVMQAVPVDTGANRLRILDAGGLRGKECWGASRSRCCGAYFPEEKP